jgi:hypothetical protein
LSSAELSGWCQLTKPSLCAKQGPATVWDMITRN